MLALAQTLHLRKASPDALLGIVANRAGVNQNHISLLDILGVDVAVLLHNRYHNLRIADIHLATVGLNEELLSLTHDGA